MNYEALERLRGHAIPSHDFLVPPSRAGIYSEGTANLRNRCVIGSEPSRQSSSLKANPD
ncbi:uncharacterized protein FOMMEDRAFT_155617 [Fomitiporia mediterranea MF3/22]|uniref:uncharacterized protein n=1 Tax=Fomitiporia mediterranea (strain MF3/22) TaxID=694068 RepID=UPI00044095E4|nr:uncharacterized protein FOMMEDRAFT_155617 [Fomitiporia mediterranea MF3/22]EJD04482.1 hypothetical protein FOMMEDRAFT_155617 [Fomitiporia mediterranea MF3/22]